MKRKSFPEINYNKFSNLRKKAEKSLREYPIYMENFSLKEIKSMIHEIQVHQVELEMQNDELQRSQEKIEVSEAKYFDLFNFAPIGFAVINEDNIIEEVNLTLSEMLKYTKADLLEKEFIKFVKWDDRDNFYFLINNIDEDNLETKSSLTLITHDELEVPVQIVARELKIQANTKQKIISIIDKSEESKPKDS